MNKTDEVRNAFLINMATIASCTGWGYHLFGLDATLSGLAGMAGWYMAYLILGFAWIVHVLRKGEYELD